LDTVDSGQYYYAHDKKQDRIVPFTYIKEHSVVVGISIVAINTIKPLWKLDVAHSLAKLWIHHEAHGFSHCFAVVDVVITIEIEEIGCICEDS
jgi:hypothetical protein